MSKDTHLKIQSGLFRGLKLKSPRGDLTRPSKSIVRSAVMNILQNDLKNAVFWDMFAGTGAIGLEAFSRGAKSVRFFEFDHTATRCIQDNIDLIQDKLQKQNYTPGDLELISTRIRKDTRYVGYQPLPNLVWMDPPYAEVPLLIATCNLLLDLLEKPKLILETDQKTDIIKLYDQGLSQNWCHQQSKVYGHTMVHQLIFEPIQN